MNKMVKDYIDNLNRECIPWYRMFTAYGTAENYNELLVTLEQSNDVEEWKEAYNKISDFEHQGTMFPPAPFTLVFLVRILEKNLNSVTKAEEVIAEKLIDQFIYYADVCSDAEDTVHAQPLGDFSDMLDEKYLLPEEFSDDDLEEIFDDPDAISDELFYSFYYYSKMVLSQVPELLDKCGKYAVESKELKIKFNMVSEL